MQTIKTKYPRVKAYALAESYPSSGVYSASKAYYYIDGERVSYHDYCVLWNKAKDGETGGFIAVGETHKTAHSRLKRCFTAYA